MVIILAVIASQHGVTLVDLSLKLLFHLVEETHDVIEVRLDLLLYELTFA